MPVKRPKDLANDVALFAQKYARKAQRGLEPNDRGYDRSVEQRIKKLPAEELSALLNQDVDTADDVSNKTSEHR